MQSITVKDVIDNTLPETGWEKYRIYVFRDEDFIFYVGKTQENIIDRLEAHLGLTDRSESLVGKLVGDNAPLSYLWSIDLYTIDECVPMIRRHYPNARGIDIDLVESAMILEYSPALNQQINPHPRALPSKYTVKRNARMLDAFKKAFYDSK
jgi:hypothetical protein